MSRVPKIIWQTYKSIEKLPADSGPRIETWLDSNPNWDYHFCSDADIESFFRRHRSPELLEVYRALPLAVMKTDLWRYAILLDKGGIYADIDTTCRCPLDDWLNTNTGMHIAVENDDSFFCQWAFASEPGHPILAAVLQLICDRVRADGGVNEKRPHYVHYYTGPDVWSEAIRKHLGDSRSPGEIQDCRRHRAGGDLLLYPAKYFEYMKIIHENASVRWAKRSSYDSWQIQRRDGLNPFVVADASVLK